MIKQILAVAALIAVIAVATVAYSLFRTPEAASGPLQSAPIESVAVVETRGEPTATANVAAPASEAETTDAEETDASTDASNPTTFEIIQSESEARFLIDEVLRGDPVTVVGVTNQVAGQIALDPANLSTVQIGMIQVNARTLATDQVFRNRAIKNQILRTNEHEFITFTPTEISGLPEQGVVGKSYTIQIVGDLTITDVTQEVIFEATVTPVSETRLEGAAATSILYRDFELFIPDSPSVDTVADEVRLEIVFAAQAVS